MAPDGRKDEVETIMVQNAVIAGTGFEGRAKTIRSHCREGRKVILKRDPHNKYDANAIEVYIKVPGLLFGRRLRQIGFIKAGTAKSLHGQPPKQL